MKIPIQTTFIAPQLSEKITEMRQRINTTSQEAVTGRHSDLTAHLGGQIGKAMLGQKAIDDIAQQRSQLALRQGRLDIVQRSLTTIQEAASGIDTRLITALGTSNMSAQDLAAKDAEASLKQVFTSLNVRHGERYLFSGDATSTQPFQGADTLIADIHQLAESSVDAAAFASALDSYFNDPAGPWQQNIYSGAQTASDPDAVTGIDPAITQLVSGLATIAAARSDKSPSLLRGDKTVLEAAAATLSAGQTAITNLRADRGIIEEHIERTKESLDLEETVLTLTFNEMTARDQYEAASELRELEANLEASYMLTSRLANLSLLNFLR